MKLPILYHKAKGGDLRQWRTWTEGPHILTEHGQVGGKLQISSKTAEGKNIGRANETSPEEQAILEANSLHKYKLDRKYSLTPEEASEELLLPMLAHKYDGSKKNKIQLPADVQPKLDGVRCLAVREGKSINLISRSGKPYNVPHIAASLDYWLPNGTMLDGELYIHGESCQRITSLVKSADQSGKSYKPESLQLSYYIYDVPVVDGNDSLTWEERSKRLHDLRTGYNIEVVIHREVKNDKEIWDAHGAYIQDGYEGAILRGRNGLYLWGYRSSDLLKVKSFQDAEFRVMDARDGKGKMEGCVVWICKNDLTDATFECTMKVTMNERARMYSERKHYIGRQLTVRFFDRTDDSLPRFPVGILFKDEKDIS